MKKEYETSPKPSVGEFILHMWHSTILWFLAIMLFGVLLLLAPSLRESLRVFLEGFHEVQRLYIGLGVAAVTWTITYHFVYYPSSLRIRTGQ